VADVSQKHKTARRKEERRVRKLCRIKERLTWIPPFAIEAATLLKKYGGWRDEFGYVPTKAYVYLMSWANVHRFWMRDPQHALFTVKGNALEYWSNKMEHLANKVAETMGGEIPRGSCWNAPPNVEVRFGHPRQIRTFKWVKLLAFFEDPTARNWDILRGRLPSYNFSHACGNGWNDYMVNTVTLHRRRGCVNGIEHGQAQTNLATNIGHRKCRSCSRSQCRGHVDPDPTIPVQYCIFVHQDRASPAWGFIQPCLNQNRLPASCQCLIRCTLEKVPERRPRVVSRSRLRDITVLFGG
jgi:hypothetical protein